MNFRELQFHLVDSTHGVHGGEGQDDDHGHFENKLEQIGDQNSPQAANERINAGKGNQDKVADR